ncbi:MAG: hypothetical protein WCY30_00025 [Candidatus Neomarinimicrobiota bacterium]|jgi:hypothetical protein
MSLYGRYKEISDNKVIFGYETSDKVIDLIAKEFIRVYYSNLNKMMPSGLTIQGTEMVDDLLRLSLLVGDTDAIAKWQGEIAKREESEKLKKEAIKKAKDEKKAQSSAGQKLPEMKSKPKQKSNKKKVVEGQKLPQLKSGRKTKEIR